MIVINLKIGIIFFSKLSSDLEIKTEDDSVLQKLILFGFSAFRINYVIIQCFYNLVLFRFSALEVDFVRIQCFQ